jgi:hypothetical protein
LSTLKYTKKTARGLGAVLLVLGICAIVAGATISNTVTSKNLVADNVSLAFTTAGIANITYPNWVPGQAMSRNVIYQFGLEVTSLASIPNCAMKIVISKVGINATQVSMRTYQSGAWSLPFVMAQSPGQLAYELQIGNLSAGTMKLVLSYQCLLAGEYTLACEVIQK